MRIRSVTLFTSPTKSPPTHHFFKTARSGVFTLEVTTCRVATAPFTQWQESHDPLAVAQAYVADGADYVSLGAIRFEDDAAELTKMLALAEAEIFGNAEMVDADGTIDLGRIHAIADLVVALGNQRDDGFANLFFTATALCLPNIPYFPTANGDGSVGFALAVESADLALKAIQAGGTLAEIQSRLVAEIEAASALLTEQANGLAEKFGIPFWGIDYSFAPFPDADTSIGGAMEAMGFGVVGANGSLFAAGFLTDALQRAEFKKAGFNGLMLPVLEDSVLAQATYSVQELLAYSAVCGIGLDTVPIPGDTSASAIAAILLDVATLAIRLQKPLTARLMPIPGKKAGDEIKFDFPFFADSAVMSITQPTIQLTNQPPFSLSPFFNE